MGWVITSRNRILSTYGGRIRSVINATGTGTQIELAPSKSNTDEETRRLKEAVPWGNDIPSYTLTAFSNQNSPINFHPMEGAGMIKTISGNPLVYNSARFFELDIGIIGNSIDDYFLTQLARIYLPNEGKSSPKLRMTIIPFSAPGFTLNLDNGIVKVSDLGFSVGTSARVKDKVFSFMFDTISEPSPKGQQYEDGEHDTLDTVLGIS